MCRRSSKKRRNIAPVTPPKQIGRLMKDLDNNPFCNKSDSDEAELAANQAESGSGKGKAPAGKGKAVAAKNKSPNAEEQVEAPRAR